MEAAVAGAAVGVTIKTVLDYLLLYPVEEIGLLKNFNRDMEKLKESVTAILLFLEDAEEKQKNKSVESWLRKLEALAFDADYVFDQLSYQHLRNKVNSDYEEKKLKVSSFISTNVNHFSLRHEMARKIKSIKKKLESTNKEAIKLHLTMRDANAQARGVGKETDSSAEYQVFVGRDDDVKRMVEKMITSISKSTEKVNALPILGMGGLGKTTLAREVYKHADVASNFGKRMWVHVGNFDSDFVLRRAVELFTTQINVGRSRENLVNDLKKYLKDTRYLLVLDNVWNAGHQDWFQFIASMKGVNSVIGNVIVVTTRSRDFAESAATIGIHELEPLTENDCLHIIKAEAFGEKGIPSQFETSGGEGIQSQFETSGQNIAERCRGLPLAAQVVGSLLRGKPEDEWVHIKENWVSYLAKHGDTVSNILKFSYDNLPLTSLKKCFAFYSIVPRSWYIEKDELIQLWMAEGFLRTDKVKDMETVGDEVKKMETVRDEVKDMETVGDEMFSLLLGSSLIEVQQKDCYGFVRRCRMHDLVHNVASSVLNHDIYPSRYMSTANLSSLPREDANCLRALFFNGEASQTMFSNFKYLHVLVLFDEKIDNLPIEIGQLISLRYLDISRTRIESLPDSIGDLYHLQTLRAITEYGSKAYLRKLPDTFKYLISLRHLHIPNIKLPPKIGKLTCLRTLPYFQVGDEEGCGIMELGSLKNLKGEIEIHDLEKVGDKKEAMSADLFHKPNLLKLKLVWNKGREGETNDVDVLEGLQPHQNLKILEIDGFKGRSFPQWISQMALGEEPQCVILDNLIEVRLSDCKECEEIPKLGHLPHLKSLYLNNLSNVKSMGSSFYGVREKMVESFPVLEKLELIGMAELTSWEGVEVSAFNCLEYLKIIDCMKLKSAPRHFPCLKELEVNNMESGKPLANICGESIHLRKLRIESVDGLERLPDKLFSNNRDLSELEIKKCHYLKELVPSLRGGGASLRKMNIGSCSNFEKLPDDLHRLNTIEEFIISGCPNLKSIPYPENELLSSQGFRSLRKLEISFCGVTELPIKMIESCTSSLEELSLCGSRSIRNSLDAVIDVIPNMPRIKNFLVVPHNDV